MPYHPNFDSSVASLTAIDHVRTAVSFSFARVTKTFGGQAGHDDDVVNATVYGHPPSVRVT